MMMQTPFQVANAGVLFVVAGILGYNAGLPPYGIPIGLVMATLGWWVIRTGAPAAIRFARNLARKPGSGFGLRPAYQSRFSKCPRRESNPRPAD